MGKYTLESGWIQGGQFFTQPSAKLTLVNDCADIELRFDNAGLYIRLTTETEDSIISEILFYDDIGNNFDRKKGYSYTRRSCSKKMDLPPFDVEGVTTETRQVTQAIDGEQLIVTNASYVDGKLEKQIIAEGEGSVYENATRDDVVTDFFNRARNLIDGMHPGLISSIFSQELVEQGHLEMFIPDYEMGIVEGEGPVR